MTTHYEPFMVHCGKCGREWAAGCTPMPIDLFVRIGKAPCPYCRSRKVLCGVKPKPTADGDAVGWLLNGDTGISSQTIWHVLMGRPMPQNKWVDAPHDPADFGRCHRLLAVMPSWRARLAEVAAKYPAWQGLVEAWDELTTLYLEEEPSGTCPKLYKRMKALRGETA